MNPPVNERMFGNSTSIKTSVGLPQRTKDLLGLRRLPARLNVAETAILLNVGEHDIPVLIRAGLLKPLGNPPPNAVKYFCAAEILDYAANPNWLSAMCDEIYRFWQNKNSAKTRRAGDDPGR